MGQETEKVDVIYPPELRQAFKEMLIDLLKNDKDVYTAVLHRSVDILTVLGYRPHGSEDRPQSDRVLKRAVTTIMQATGG